jgi:formate dehydrogenase subunit gamma
MNLHIGTAPLTAPVLSERVLSIVNDRKCLEGPLLPILHDVQAEFGYVPQEALPIIAKELNLSRAEVHGVMTFYHDYRAHPAGRHIVKLCRAEACQSMGGDALGDSLKRALGIDWHDTTPDGMVTLEPVYCLGLCACAPAAMIDGDVYGRLDGATLETLVAEVRA